MTKPNELQDAANNGERFIDKNGRAAYRYDRKVGRKAYTVIVRESKDAKLSVTEKVKKLLLMNYDKEFGHHYNTNAKQGN